MALYKDSSEVLSISFNATKTSNEDWFSKKRLVHSPWTDLESEQENYFAVQGALDKGVKRVFYINQLHGGCERDAGWLMVSIILTVNMNIASLNQLSFTVNLTLSQNGVITVRKFRTDNSNNNSICCRQM